MCSSTLSANDEMCSNSRADGTVSNMDHDTFSLWDRRAAQRDPRPRIGWMVGMGAGRGAVCSDLRVTSAQQLGALALVTLSLVVVGAVGWTMGGRVADERSVKYLVFVLGGG